ncbi:hypothetical protein QJS66_04605 [Kocuria rhizophila]|nr:hypothetical protein QJS66_04605 [Kocuria rhizophila]
MMTTTRTMTMTTRNLLEDNEMMDGPHRRGRLRRRGRHRGRSPGTR